MSCRATLILCILYILYSWNEPGGDEAREISFLVVVDVLVRLQNEVLLFTKGSDDSSA